VTLRERAAALGRVTRRPEAIAFAILFVVATLLALAQQGTERPQSEGGYTSYGVDPLGYRAWDELLLREGLSVTTFERHAVFLDASTRTLIYAEPPEDRPLPGPSAADLAAMQSWVEAGGHLLYLGHDDDASAAGLFSLPATVPPRPLPPKAKRTHATPPPRPRGLAALFAPGAADDRYAKRFRVRCGCVVGVLRLAPALRDAGVGLVDPRSHLRWYPARGKRFSSLVGDGRGELVVRYALGRGDVTAVLDESLFDNARIGRFDHARLALALAGTGAVAFDEVPHGYLTPETWWQVIPQPLFIAILIVLLAVLVAIAGASVRLGPPVLPFAREPTSVEFIDSLAGLFERNGAARASLEDAVASVRRTVATSAGFLASASPDEVAERLRSTQDRADFRELLAMPGLAKIDDLALVRGLTLAQRLRKDYAHGRSRN